MKKYEYLSELEKRLSALPADARRDALNYYEEYFDAAHDTSCQADGLPGVHDPSFRMKRDEELRYLTVSPALFLVVRCP